MNPLPSLLAGAVFGLALAAPPGPMNAVIAEESVNNGWLAGVRTGLGAMTADATFLVGSLLGVVTFVERFPTVRAVMIGIGGVLMCYFAYGAAMDALGETEPVPSGDTPRRAVTGFRKAFVLALTNPYQILFWLTIGVGLLQPGQLDVLSYTPYVGSDLAGLLLVRTGSPALILGFFVGIGIWITGFPATLRAAQRRVAAFTPVVAGVSALVLAGFGVVFLVDAVRTLT
ncbi:LysE family translocator [Haloplanus sp. C73]|uniref:LysE family translocator n=1 Tax=Haloplanus sp. C73 TaxID=3421641 RepID=UPI003EBD3FE5